MALESVPATRLPKMIVCDGTPSFTEFLRNTKNTSRTFLPLATSVTVANTIAAEFGSAAVVDVTTPKSIAGRPFCSPSRYFGDPRALPFLGLVARVVAVFDASPDWSSHDVTSLSPVSVSVV